MRSLAFVLLAAACGPEFAVVPAGGSPYASAQVAGSRLTAFAQQWNGEPFDLADTVTPIAVELYNSGATPIRILYVDFELRDESGRRFFALNPFTAAAAVSETD